MRNALRRVRRVTGVGLAFSGTVHSDGLCLDRFDGDVVGPLRGARLDLGYGLGGRVVAQARAMAVSDYCGTPTITHHYDWVIRAESIRAIAAVPVIVGRRPLAVLYAALRTGQQETGRLLDAVAGEARSLEQELVAVDVLQRVSGGERSAGVSAERMRLARVRDAHSRLRILAGETEDPRLREHLLETADLLTDPEGDMRAGVHLTRRELDVLALLAAGMSNQEIASHLAVGVYTVKGHLKALFSKLGGTGRLDVVARARRRGLVP